MADKMRLRRVGWQASQTMVFARDDDTGARGAPHSAEAGASPGRRSPRRSRPNLRPSTGEPLESNNLKKRYFKPILEAAGLPDMRLDDLRHTAATLRLVNGEHPKVVQEMLGHASITLTMDTYSHVLPGMQEESAARLDRLLRG